MREPSGEGVPAHRSTNELAATAIERFAAVGAEDTPGFAALLDEFPTNSSRGNLKVILWRLADHLRSSAARFSDG